MPDVSDDLETRIREAMGRGDWGLVGRLGRELDAAHRATAPALASSALWYAAQGLAVFPLVPGGKRPWPGSHGCRDATCDEQQIRSWWGVRPEANIGVATGGRVDVIDVDGPVGCMSRARNPRLFTMPVLGVVSTPRPGGCHLYVAASGRGNRAGLLPGIDYRGAGGYVVAPPSVIDRRDPDRSNAHGAYVWLAPLGAPRVSCRLHGDAPRPDVCWTCQEVTKGPAA